ncbi:MAG TPA: RNA polymerase sigma-70 factor [Streptosporangiaceae bacterium]|nr:RNA polymerase sigma-70 factor [Streptosporangiaceae bacterium]
MTGADAAATSALYQDLRPLLFSIAYRMLGSVSEAEDVVQEAFLRYHRASGGGQHVPESPKAYLSAVTTRLCIDQLRSARVRRESYVGEWLPEPLLTGPEPLAQIAPDPQEHAEQADTLSMAFLLVLERLSPLERAVFLLHDVFSYDYDETAGIVGRSAATCRQLAHRARQHMDAERPRFEVEAAQRNELAARFFDAVGRGDMEGLVDLLAADVEVHGDSGGVPPSWPRPIIGRDKVTRLLISLGEQISRLGGSLNPVEVNGQPGALVQAPDGSLVNVFSLDIADGQIQMIRSVINRDKLRHLGPLADVAGLREQLRE